jgi:hypothetical protein
VAGIQSAYYIFNYDPPTISYIDPPTAHTVDPNQLIYIYGNNFGTLSATSSVTVGGSVCPIVDWANQLLSCVTKAN